MDRNAILRTSFHWDGLDKPVQVVHLAATLILQVEDWSDRGSHPHNERLERFLERDRTRSFDLAVAPLSRLVLVRCGERRFVLIWTLHHLILDGWSCGLIRDQMFADYEAAVTGRHVSSDAGPPFSHYIAWLGSQDPVSAETFWKRELAGVGEPPRLTDALPAREAPADVSAVDHNCCLSARVSTALKTLARRQHVTLSSLFQAAWAILLSRYSGQDEVVFGLTVSGRSPSIRGVERMIGNLINTVPFRARLSQDADVAGLLTRIHAANGRIQPYEHAPLAEIQTWVRASGTPALFDSILVFENASAPPPAPSSSRLLLHAQRHLFRTNYPVVVQVSPGEEIAIRIACDHPRLGHAAVARLASQLATLLSAMAADPRSRVVDLPILTAAERHLAVREWNDTAREYPACSLPEAFEQQAARSPAAVALIHRDRTCSYAELNERARSIGRALRVQGVRANVPVALHVQRSPDMVAALLGILKAGGVCVPLDPSYPPERLAFMLNDSGARIVVTERGLAEDVRSSGADVLLLDEIGNAGTEDENLSDHPLPGQAAYVIYTSGSTGTPKGVVVPHRAVLRLVCNTNYVRLDGTQASLAHSPNSFDASFFELWSTLLHGGRCVLVDGRGVTPADLRRVIAASGVDLLWLTASLFHLVMDEDPDALAGVRQLFVGGEIVSPRHAAQAAERLPGAAIANGYGPTEATTFSTFFRVSARTAASERVPLGRPIANTRVYVLDQRLNPCPIGVAGEIFIGGAGVAQGYVGAPQLTAERFVPDPFGTEAGARLYRTGDRARLLETGDIDFLGRTDDQVKIRGFRVEPMEVEAALRKQPSVRDCAVTTIEEPDGSRRLVACVVLDATEGATAADLRRGIARVLPDHMVPADFIFLDELPRTPHGKLNRRALPAPQRTTESSQPRVSGTGTPIEEILTGIWCAVLGVDRVERTDDFFHLGGHSLLAIRALSRIREAFGVDVPLRALFEHSTLGGLALEIGRVSGATGPRGLPPLEREPHDGVVPLSFAQERLWVIDQLALGIPAYNLPIALSLTGSDAGLPGLLLRSLQTLVERHEVLRTTLPVLDGRPVQHVQGRGEVDMPLVDLSLLPEQDRAAVTRRLASAAAVGPFDLGSGPLLRALLIRHAPARHVLLLTVHHIVADGASLEVLLDELIQAFSCLSAGRPCDLPPLPVQYGDYARWQRRWMRGERLDELLSFWRAQLADVPPPIRLPTDRPRPALQTFRGGRQTITFPRELFTAIDELARVERATPFMILLAGLFALLHRYTGEVDLLVGTPAANRNRVELEPLIGFFANTLVLRTRVDGRRSFRDLVAAVRDTTLKAYAHQDLPFEKLVEELQPTRQLGTSPYFHVMFAMQHVKPMAPVEGLTIVPLETETLAAKFDLTMYVIRSARELRVSIDFNRDLFDSSTILRLLDAYTNLIAAAAEDAGTRVSELALLSETEAHQIVREWNDTQAAYAADPLIHELFEAQVTRTPEAIAVKHNGEQVTYRELNRMANGLARRWRELGVGPETTVAVFLRRTSRMVAALLAILKAGGAYVPLDPEYPPQRLAFMLEDVQAALVVTEPALADRLTIPPDRIFVLDDDLDLRGHDSNLTRVSSPRNMAYIIYTSGSTGTPKGIMVEHRNAVVLLHWVRDTFPSEELAGMLAGTSICFDVSVFELFGPLSWGGSVRLIENVLEMPLYTSDPTIRLVGSVPSAFAALTEAGAIPRSATTVNLAGEPVPTGLADAIYRHSDAHRITNLYGPSEDTTFSSMAVLPWGLKEAPSIGRPIANTRLFVLDGELRPVPAGTVGQLYIAGDGLTRGYFGRPALTAERFLPDPLSGDAGARMYRTGDHARHRMNGALEYVGRLDHQVKIRGFRVELGEIEAVLQDTPGVKQAVVVARAEEPQLTAYIVRQPGVQQRPDAIDAAARGRLPEYMVPGAYIVLETLPTLPNGKVDRASLQMLAAPAPAPRAEDTRPGTDVEMQMVEVLRESLNRSNVGIHDHLFSDLGAHSLLVIQVAARLRDRLGLPVSVIELFQFPTVATLAAHLAARDGGDRSEPIVEQLGRQRLDAIDKRRRFRRAAHADTGGRRV